MGRGVKEGLWCNLLWMWYGCQIVSPHSLCKGGSRYFTSCGLFAYQPQWGLRSVDNAKSLGIRHGGKKGNNCLIKVVLGGWHNDGVKCKNTHKQKFNVLKFNGKFLFILLTSLCSLEYNHLYWKKQWTSNNGKIKKKTMNGNNSSATIPYLPQYNIKH